MLPRLALDVSKHDTQDSETEEKSLRFSCEWKKNN